MKYWRTTSKSGVDFVLFVNNEVVPIEVKFHGRIRRSFRSFLSAYKPGGAIVFTEKESGMRDINKTKSSVYSALDGVNLRLLTPYKKLSNF